MCLNAPSSFSFFLLILFLLVGWDQTRDQSSLVPICNNAEHNDCVVINHINLSLSCHNCLLLVFLPQLTTWHCARFVAPLSAEDEEHFIDFELPAKWLWDIIDEFIYQV